MTLHPPNTFQVKSVSVIARAVNLRWIVIAIVISFVVLGLFFGRFGVQGTTSKAATVNSDPAQHRSRIDTTDEAFPRFTDVSPRAANTTNQQSTSGRVLAIAQTGTRLYAATPQAGLFVSSNGGQMWSQIQFTNAAVRAGQTLPGPTIIDVASDPGDGERVLAVSGPINDALRSTGSVSGVYLSTNGGVSWRRTWHGGCSPGEGQPRTPAPAEGVMFVRHGLAVAWGGCEIGVSTDGGESFHDYRVSGQVRQVVVDAASGIGYACGPNTRTPSGTSLPLPFWSTPDIARSAWSAKVVTINGVSGNWCGGNPPDVSGFWRALAVQPGNPSIVYSATQAPFNVWRADFSVSSPTFQPLPPPMGSTATASGAVTVMTQPHRDAPGFVMLFNNSDYLFAAEGEPGSSGSWYEMTGRPGTNLAVHADTHGLAIDPNFDMVLNDRGVQGCGTTLISGFLWAGTDGGVYITTTCGRNWANSGGGAPGNGVGGLSTLVARVMGTAFAPGRQVLSFGGQDNGDYVTRDGGASWSGLPESGCGDCGDWYSDALNPTWIMSFDITAIREYTLSPWALSGRRRPSGLKFYQSTGPVPIRPVIQTLPSEAGNANKRDAVWIEDVTSEDGSVVPWLMRSSSPSNETRSIRTLPANSFGIQASGGHATPLYYVWNSQDKSLLRFRAYQSFEYLISNTRAAETFFVNPYVPNEVWIVEIGGPSPGIKQWNQTSGLWIPAVQATLAATGGNEFTVPCTGSMGGIGINCLVNDMLFVPGEATRFIAGKGGVFYTLDGTSWQRLFSTDQIPGIPWHMAFDKVSSPGVRSLYVSFLGRGVLRFDNIPTLPAAPTN